MIVQDGNKPCSRCRELLPISEFGKDSRKASGLASRCKACNRKAVQRTIAKDPEKARRQWRDSALRRQYGISLEDYEQMFESQSGVCLICESPPSKERGLDVDHCHDTGRVRGLLCRRCNMGIGYFSDSGLLLHRATEYINRSIENGV